MKVCFVINPKSGAEQGEALVRALTEFSQKLEYESTVIVLSESVRAAVAVHREKYDMVLVAGGDGTIQSLLPTLLNTKTVLGILPLGTGNDLAKEIDHYQRLTPKNITSAAQSLLSREAIDLSVWNYRGNEIEGLFCNYISFGFDGVVTSKFERAREGRNDRPTRFRRIRNRFTYLFAGLWELGYLLPSNITAKKGEEIIQCDNTKSLIITNLCSYTGMGWITSIANATDDKIELIKMQAISDYLLILPRRFGLNIRDKAISSSNWEVNFGGSLVPFQVDGDYKGMIDGQVLINKAGSIRVVEM